MSIQDLLSHPLIWRGRDGSSMDAAALPSGFHQLDQYLPGGGWPLAGVTEVFVERYGIGELSILMPALALLSNETLAAKKWIVWIAPPFIPYAPALLRYGIDLNRVLLVHPSGSHADVLWAAEQVIKSRSSAAALVWLKDADVPALRRLQLGAEEHRCWTMLFRPVAAMTESSPAALRIKLKPASAGTNLEHTFIEVQKCRGRRPRTIAIDDSMLRSAGKTFDAGSDARGAEWR